MPAKRGELAQAMRDYLATRRKTAFTSGAACRALPQYSKASIRGHLQKLSCRGILIATETPNSREHTYQEASLERLGRRSGRMVMSDELISAMSGMSASSHG